MRIRPALLLTSECLHSVLFRHLPRELSLTSTCQYESSQPVHPSCFADREAEARRGSNWLKSHDGLVEGPALEARLLFEGPFLLTGTDLSSQGMKVRA